MDSNGTHDKTSDSDAKSKDNTPSTANTPTDTNKSPRKRRKVNHGPPGRHHHHISARAVFLSAAAAWARANFGRAFLQPAFTAADLDPDAKKPKSSNHAAARDESDTQTELSRNSIDRSTNAMVPPSFDSNRPSQGTKPGLGPLGQGNHLQLVSPSPVSGAPAMAGFSDAWLTAQNQFHDMHHYNPQYMLPQEVTHEFNLLNDFLNTSLLDENGTLTDEQNLYRNQSQSSQADMAGFLGNPLPLSAMEANSMLPPNSERHAIQRPKSAAPPDKTREFYLQAADPSGNDTPEARMQRVLKAKYDAGLLKPFNYIKGYARLSNYMDGHIAPASKQKILRQLDRFRPKFREKVQGLTDMELVYVEMWFEKSLMEYDRVFASMAVPACCWRRSGEIFRGNKEMAELIHVPVERLRDGKISIHEVMTEDSLVRYWEEFGTIAFDPAHDTLLTACALKNPDDRSNDPSINCCFSFMIRRDDHKISIPTAYRPAYVGSYVTDSSVMPYLNISIDGSRPPAEAPYNQATIQVAATSSPRSETLTPAAPQPADFIDATWLLWNTTILPRRSKRVSSLMLPFVCEPAVDSKKLALIFKELCSNLRALSFDKTTDSSPRDLNNEIENQIQSLKTYSPRSLKTEHHNQLNTAGLGLWNWCTQEKRREDNNAPSTRDRFFCLVRVLSFSMLALAQRRDVNSPRAIIHLERLAIKTGRSCIASNELEYGLWTLQKAVEYNGLLQSLQGSSPEESHICSRFEAEYYTLRIVLASAWKEDRMDVAENLYASVGKLMEQVDIASAEKLADALFEIGRDLTLKKNSALAVKWLERALELINSQEIGQLSRDAIELRLAISQALIQAYLDIGTPDYITRAENHIAYIEDGMGDKLVVLLFRTEVLLRSPAETFDSNAYADILRRMMRVVDISESSFKLLMHHIWKLDERKSIAASSVLDDFLINRILPCQREQWIDKAITLRTHMAVRDSSLQSTQALQAVLDQVLASMGKPLAVNTAAGIQTLIWKKADAEFSQEKFDPASKWCRVALHPALEQSGPSNAGKMARKLLLCAIQQNDLAAASDILQSMNDVTLKEPMTAYLAFKVALKQEDVDITLKCLEQISEASPSEPQYLYACCLEAQQAQAKIITIKALQHIVLKHKFHSSNSIHLPALLRVLIRLEVSVLYDKQEIDTDEGSLVGDLCNIFKTAVSEIEKERRDSKGEKLFTVNELDWFCKNAYNLGLENATAWEARHVITILECCLSIISSYPSDIPAQMVADTSLRGMFCNFMAATVLLALARSEDNVELRLQDYLNMRRHVQRFHELLESRSDSLDETSREDLETKLSTLLVFEFEGATCLKS
ncbi:hypothetical protein E0Z10_g9466 [Xylaria hypoxylon]|uniref:ERT1/acuK family PAS domain-containing protein n=1 Tax=Xylaria hypoxylon TaxID=37992 RepID=A0A4Z0YKD0_9PEZI|nr:hypothetical protein E0Z10_g9466 [Xylaria hypoxylon]